MTRLGQWALAALALGVLAVDGQTLAQRTIVASNEAEDLGEFDCVIEPKMTIKLGSPDTGIIQEVRVDRNSRVKQGEVVAQLDSDLQRIAVEQAKVKAMNEIDLQSERTRLGYRAAEEERAKALHKRDFASSKTRDEAVTERQLAELALSKAGLEHKMAELELDQAQARLERRSVRSPVDGVVSDVTIRPGEYAYDQTPLMVIAQIDPLYIKVFLPVKLYRKLHPGSFARVFPEEPIGGMYKAQIRDMDKVFDAASSTFGVRLELPNKDYELPAGLRCRIRFDAAATAVAKP